MDSTSLHPHALAHHTDHPALAAYSCSVLCLLQSLQRQHRHTRPLRTAHDSGPAIQAPVPRNTRLSRSPPVHPTLHPGPAVRSPSVRLNSFSRRPRRSSCSHMRRLLCDRWSKSSIYLVSSLGSRLVQAPARGSLRCRYAAFWRKG